MATKCFAILSNPQYEYITEDPVTLRPKLGCIFVTVDDEGLGGDEYTIGASVIIEHGDDLASLKNKLVGAIQDTLDDQSIEVVWLNASS